MVHIWHEDNQESSTTQFWEFIISSGICNEIKGTSVIGFGGNSKLVDYLRNCKINPADK